MLLLMAPEKRLYLVTRFADKVWEGGEVCFYTVSEH